MSTASLKSVFGGGNYFPTFFSGTLIIAAGASGAIATITAPTGKKVRLTGLITVGSPGAVEGGIRIATSYGNVVNGLTLTNGSNAVGHFNIGFNSVIGGFADSALAVPYIESADVITISKISGSTSNIIIYSYSFGD